MSWHLDLLSDETRKRLEAFGRGEVLRDHPIEVRGKRPRVVIKARRDSLEGALKYMAGLLTSGEASTVSQAALAAHQHLGRSSQESLQARYSLLRRKGLMP